MAKAMQDCVLLLGDSLIEMQQTERILHIRLSQAYCRKLDVLNRGFGGWNTNGIRVLLDAILAPREQAHAPAVRLAIVWLGTNDAVLPPADRHVPLFDFKDNLNHILSALTSPDSPYAVAQTPISIILITPGTCVPSMFPDPSKAEWCTPTSMKEYRDAVLEVGVVWKEKREVEDGRWTVEVVDLLKDMEEASGQGLERFFLDGVHLSPAGYDIVWNGVSKVIKQKFADRVLTGKTSKTFPLAFLAGLEST